MGFPELLIQSLPQHKQAVISALMESPKNQKEQAQRYWQDLLFRQLSFDTRQQLVEAIEAVTETSIKSYYNSVVLRPSQRLWIISEKTDTLEPPRFQAVTSHQAFKQSYGIHQYP